MHRILTETVPTLEGLQNMKTKLQKEFGDEPIILNLEWVSWQLDSLDNSEYAWDIMYFLINDSDILLIKEG